MNKEKVLCSHELVIRFDQLEGNRVNWYLTPDERVGKTASLNLLDLAECGAPLAALGIRALWKLCADGLIYNSLEQANDIQEAVYKRLASTALPALIEQAPEGVTIN
jgi:hypothetical protein